jgi:RND family efflux transporter MFP subunit
MLNYNRKNSFGRVLLWTFFILGSGSIMSACSSEEPESGANGKREFQLPVQAGKVVFRDVVDEIRTVGNLEAEQRVTVNAEVSGQITRILVDEGKKVREGTILAHIDSREYILVQERLESDLEAAKMDYEKSMGGLRPEEKEKLEAQVKADESGLLLAEKEKARITSLVDDGVLAQSALDKAEDESRQAQERLRSSNAALSAGMQSRDEDIVKSRSEMEVTEKHLEQAELDVSRTKIRAPFDGVILAKKIEQGAYAKEGSAILEMIGSKNLKAVLEVPKSYRKKLEHLKGAEFIVKELDLKFKHGANISKYVRVIPDANIYSGNIKVMIDLPNPDPALFPGLSLESRLKFGTRRNVKHVPSVALVISDKGTVVYIVKDMKAHLVPVKAFKEKNEFVEIEDFTHQLGKDVDLILRGSGAVFPGVKVFITNPKPEAETKTPFNSAQGSPKKSESPQTPKS